MKLKIFTISLFLGLNIGLMYSQDVAMNTGNTSESSIRYSEYHSELPISPKTNNEFRYYYYPNLQAYYDNLKRVFYYKMDGQWITGEKLPPNYGGYSIYNKCKVIIEGFVDDNPYTMIQAHKTKFPYNARGLYVNEEN